MAIPASPTQKESIRALAPAEFLKELSLELARGDIRLPSFPSVAERVQRALEDPRATPAKVARVIGIDAALAVRILQLANSAFLNPSSRPITELQQAVNRLGHQLVRCTAVSFALQQMMKSGEVVLRPQLHELWRQGTLVASIAYVLARETGAANPDEALVAGLMHNIGSLYIIMRAHQHGARLGSDDAATRLLNQGHPRIAGAILGHWKFAPAIVSAVGNQNASNLPPTDAGPLTDVLIAAISLVPCVFSRELLDETVTAGAPFQRLALNAADCTRLLSTTAQQIKSLHSALVG
ncbi:MAG TPA: HDOD domain-containing protein [Steroidobacteraceae bacterium]|jgi:HD-like signal output (HDOD) protein|nr:HDOD domain-containing protein [Steroidobacteraceae bacterium]